MSSLAIPMPSAPPDVGPDRDLVCTWQITVHLPIVIRQVRQPTLGDVDQALERQAARLERARVIIAALTDRIDGWSVRTNRREIVLEIESDLVDAPTVELLLRGRGIGAAEASVRVQYARRWGIL